jgi:hypothetical protein
MKMGQMIEKDYPQWIYSANEEAKIISHSELDLFLADGWVENPAQLDGTIDKIKVSLGFKEDEELASGEINAIGQMYKEITDIENFKLQMDKKTNAQIKKFIEWINEGIAKESNVKPVKIPKNATKAVLKDIVNSL